AAGLVTGVRRIGALAAAVEDLLDGGPPPGAPVLDGFDGQLLPECDVAQQVLRRPGAADRPRPRHLLVRELCKQRFERALSLLERRQRLIARKGYHGSSLNAD